MPTVIIPREHRADFDPNALGTPAHFAAYCRRAGLAGNTVIILKDEHAVPGFKIPEDGAWFVNGNWVKAGEVVDIIVGSRVTYYTVGRNPDDDDPRAGRIGPVADVDLARQVRVDPRTMEALPPGWGVPMAGPPRRGGGRP